MVMAENVEKRHEHHGKSSKGFLDAGKVLGYIGIVEGDRFLDLGSGEGYFSIAASRAVGRDGLVHAFDVDEETIARLNSEIADNKITNIEASVVDITKKLPLADESISLAFMSNVLHGLVVDGDAEGTFKEIARVTAHNGKFAVVEFKKQDSPMGPPLSIRLSPEDVEAYARGFGFLNESVREVGPYHYAIIFRKK
jgi:ubiquinone/menaquinone biosynthesis C-methylase UbiE